MFVKSIRGHARDDFFGKNRWKRQDSQDPPKNAEEEVEKLEQTYSAGVFFRVRFFSLEVSQSILSCGFKKFQTQMDGHCSINQT